MTPIKKTIIANWKMNPTSIAEAKETFLSIKKTAHKLKNIETVICPPFVYLNLLKKLYIEETVALGAQNVSFEDSGARTGEISPSMVKSVGASFVIIGHSERRAMGEDDEMVNKKVLAALKNDLSVVLCVGESERDSDGDFLSILKDQIANSLRSVQRRHFSNLYIAYEPVWAIGKAESDAMSPEILREMGLYVRKTLIDYFKSKDAAFIPILYGGSTTAGNAEAILKVGEVDGLLVGRESLDAPRFSQILTLASKL